MITKQQLTQENLELQARVIELETQAECRAQEALRRPEGGAAHLEGQSRKDASPAMYSTASKPLSSMLARHALAGSAGLEVLLLLGAPKFSPRTRNVPLCEGGESAWSTREMRGRNPRRGRVAGGGAAPPWLSSRKREGRGCAAAGEMTDRLTGKPLYAPGKAQLTQVRLKPEAKEEGKACAAGEVTML